METKPPGKFICLKCELEFLSPRYVVTCPRCGHSYVKWLNFEELREGWRKGGYPG